jgi:hypothetical protein
MAPLDTAGSTRLAAASGSDPAALTFVRADDFKKAGVLQ